MHNPNQFQNCEGGLMLSRRTFLKATAILSFAALPELSIAKSDPEARLLTILLRGGLDGMHAMPPIGDKLLAGLRPTINPDDRLPLDKFFALHPAFKTVHEMYKKNEALLIHGASFPYTRRSHFEGQDIMESGGTNPYALKTGWLGRALDLQGYDSVAMSLPVPLILRGARPESVYPSWMTPVPIKIYEQIIPLWANDLTLAVYGNQAQQELESMQGKQVYPTIQAGDRNSLADLARDAGKRLARENGPRMAVLDHVGFDTHANETQQNSRHFEEVDSAIAAFRQEIGDAAWKKTLIVTVTEFGRTANENGSHGTDHGYGTAIFVLGGRLKKGGIVSDWPGLRKKNLFEGRDLMATIDARSLYGAIMSNVLDIDPERVRRDVIEHTPTDLFAPYL